MTPEELQALIAQGETFTVEFKSDVERLSDDELVETVVCLANADGGYLLLGVEDDGQITGLHRVHQNAGAGQVTALITNRTTPSVHVQVAFISLTAVRIAVIQVPRASSTVATTAGRFLVRYLEGTGKPGCRPLSPHDLTGRAINQGQRDITSEVVPNTSWDDLDILEIARLRRLLQENSGDAVLLNLDDVSLTRALRLTRLVDGVNVPTLAGLLMIGTDRALQENVPMHEVAFQIMRRQDVILNEVHRGPLLRVFERILELLAIRNEQQELTIGLSRIGIPLYDQRALREAINNAFVHRDYTRLGLVQIQMRDSEVIIRNVGGFIEGVTLNNLLVVGPQARNPLLAEVFKRTGLVERTGRGVGLMFTGQVRTGRLPPDFSRTTAQNVAVVLPGGPADVEFVRALIMEERRRTEPFDIDELLVLSYLRRERELDYATASRLTQKSEDDIRHVLERLVDAGIVERRGHVRNRRYIFSAGMYRNMGQPAEYIRRSGFEQSQIEQMILQYTQTNGRVNRRDVVNLCRINENQAYYVLVKLVNQGLLQRQGLESGRGVYYTVPSTLPMLSD